MAGRFSRKSRVDISLGYKWTRVDTGESVLCVSFSWSRRFYTPPNYTELSSLFKRVHPCVIRANMQSWLTYMRVSVYRRKTHDTYRDVESVRPCVSRFPSPCAYSNPLSSPSVTGIEINKQASGAISRSVNIYLTVSRLELPASGVVGRHLRLNLRSWLHRRFLF